MIDGKTEIGDGTHVFPFASIGMMPQDLKYRGEPTRLKIGKNNVFREFVTIHRGTEMGGGLTSIGDNNLFMAYAHVAHDCRIGNYTIFGNAATLGGHVWSRTSRRSPRSLASTSSAASASTPSSAATRSSPRTRCRTRRPSATARASTASIRSA